MPNPITWVRNKIKQLYAWTVKWSKTKYSEQALAAISFAESSFFPIPPDPLLIALVLANPKKWIRFAIITTAFSVIGGLFGYLIGWALIESAGDWILDTYHLRDSFNTLGESFQENTAIAVFAAALTPIPYKILTISAGAFQVNLGIFIIASIIGRGARFFAVAALTSVLGKKYKEQIDNYIDIISFVVLGIIILLFFIASKV